LKVYINALLPTPLPLHQLDDHRLPFTQVHIFNQFYLHLSAIHDDEPEFPDIVRDLCKSQTHPYGQFDTVVVLVNDSVESTGLAGW